MFHAVTKQLEIYIDVNIELSYADHYTFLFTSRNFRLVLEITFLLNKFFFRQTAYELLSQSRKLNKQGGANKSGGVGNVSVKVSVLIILIYIFVYNNKRIRNMD